VKRTLEELEEVCRTWNEANPVGTPVVYQAVAGCCETRIQWTRTKAVVIAGKSAVCWITGHVCAIALTWLRPIPASAVPALRMPLLLGTDAFWLRLVINPLMAHHRLTIQCVGRRWLNPHSPDFPVLFLHVLEREYYFGALLQTESIEQSSHVFRLDDALYTVLRLRESAEFSRQFVRSCELANSGSSRRTRWR
jgi:hypothetical protein